MRPAADADDVVGATLHERNHLVRGRRCLHVELSTGYVFERRYPVVVGIGLAVLLGVLTAEAVLFAGWSYRLGQSAPALLFMTGAVALTIVVYLHVVVGEMVPKNLAIARPEGVTFALATAFRLSNTLMKPLIVFFNAAANATVRLLGIEPQDELTATQSLEELQVLIRSSREGGGLQEEEFSLLARSISFGDKVCADALTPRVAMVALDKTDRVADLQRTALESGHSRFPVTGESIDDIIGVAYLKDVTKRECFQFSKCRLTVLRDDFGG